jgi:hypothetical protein
MSSAGGARVYMVAGCWMDRENGCNTEAKSAGAEFRRWADRRLK